MASAHIEITGSVTRHNSKLRTFVDQLQSVQDKAAQLKAAYDQAALGNDWEALRDTLGLEPDAQGTADAEDIYNLIGSVQTELNATFITQLLGRLG